MDPLPEELQIRVDTALRGGEKLVWSGQPIPGRSSQAAGDGVKARRVREAKSMSRRLFSISLVT